MYDKTNTGTNPTETSGDSTDSRSEFHSAEDSLRPRRPMDRGPRAVSKATTVPRRFRRRTERLTRTLAVGRPAASSWLNRMNPVVTAEGAVLWKASPWQEQEDEPDVRRCPHHYYAQLAAAATTARVPEKHLAWAAGLFDGEGCIGAYLSTHSPGPDGRPRKPSLRLVASVAQNRPEVLQQFLDLVGAHGRIYPVRRQKCHNKQCYTLNFDGRHALELVYVLLPHLRRKVYEAEVARELAIDGRLGMHPGPHGLPQDVVEARQRLADKLSRLK